MRSASAARWCRARSSPAVLPVVLDSVDGFERGFEHGAEVVAHDALPLAANPLNDVDGVLDGGKIANAGQPASVAYALVKHGGVHHEERGDCAAIGGLLTRILEPVQPEVAVERGQKLVGAHMVGGFADAGFQYVEVSDDAVVAEAGLGEQVHLDSAAVDLPSPLSLSISWPASSARSLAVLPRLAMLFERLDDGSTLAGVDHSSVALALVFWMLTTPRGWPVFGLSRTTVSARSSSLPSSFSLAGEYSRRFDVLHRRPKRVVGWRRLVGVIPRPCGVDLSFRPLGRCNGNTHGVRVCRNVRHIAYTTGRPLLRVSCHSAYCSTASCAAPGGPVTSPYCMRGPFGAWRRLRWFARLGGGFGNIQVQQVFEVILDSLVVGAEC